MTMTVTCTEAPAVSVRRPRFVAGRVVLWRGPESVQIGLDPRHAVVVDGLSPPLVAFVRTLDGSRSTGELIAASRADAGEAGALLTELTAAGVVEDAELDDRVPRSLAPDLATGMLHSHRRPVELLAQRTGTVVDVHGDSRVAIAIAVLLAANGVGCVRPHAAGRVAAADIGTGYREQDIGLLREHAAKAAIHRHAGHRHRAVAAVPDIAVLADAAAYDPALALRLVADRVPHLAVQAREGSIVVGPLVLPGRTSCLRCVNLHRAARDPCWPDLLAQLVNRPAGAELTTATAAAGIAVEQVLGLLAGPDKPPSVGATLELDLLPWRLTRRCWPAHPRCGCKAW